MDEHYVYLIAQLDGTPRYVGKGKGQRWKVHFRKVTNIHLSRLIAETNGELPVKLIREGLTSKKACALEVRLIKSIGRKDLGTGPLFNLTSGGQGVSKPNKATRQKIGNVHRGIPLSDEHRKKLSKAARNRTPEVAKKIRESRIGKIKQTDKSKQAIGKAHRKRFASMTPKQRRAYVKKSMGLGRCTYGPLSREHRDNVSKALRGKPWSKARREAHELSKQ